MKNIKYSLFVFFAFFGILFSSCEKFLDVNENPNKIREDVVTMKSLLTAVTQRTGGNSYSAARNTARATHQLDASTKDYYVEGSISGPWSGVYLHALNTIKVLKNKAGEESPYYKGIGMVLEAYNLGLLTDIWENVPYTEALDLSNLFPAYDTQEDVYIIIQNLLTNAIIELGAEESVFVPGNDDLIYGGDLDKWKKLAYSLKARYHMHLSNKTINYDNILTEVENGFTSNDDDFQLNYNSVQKNPLFTGIANPNTTGNYTVTFGNYFIELLNGDIYNVVDPRLPIIADNGGDEEWIGQESWNDELVSNCDFAIDSWHSRETAPFIMMSYSELMFIKAEAALSSDPVAAYEAYIAGITANMTKLGVSQEDIDTYLASDDVNVGSDGLGLDRIMKEKYITTFFNLETWTDMRRHHYSTAVYKDYFEPVDDEFDTDIPGQRAKYPSSERERNSENATSDDNLKDFETVMWRDKN